MESLGKAIHLKDDEGDTCHPEEPQQENRRPTEQKLHIRQQQAE
jgi:hypothetical protein